MPNLKGYPNYHALRVHLPNFDEYHYRKDIKSYNGIDLQKPIDVVYGRNKKDAKNHLTTQSLRFPLETWTSREVMDWVRKNKVKYITFDKALNEKQIKFSKDMLRKLPIFKIVPQDCDFLEIAIVDNPAIDEYFLKFSDNQEIKLEFNSDKQIIKGAVMIPDKLIYRNDAMGERFVTYDEQGIQEAAMLFLKNGFKFNDKHTDKKLDIQIIETHFATEPNELGVPKGSWIVSAKVNDKELWNDLKNNDKGFSFQSLFSNEMIGTELIEFNKNNIKKMTVKEKLLNFIDTILFSEEEVKEVGVETAEEGVETKQEVIVEPVVEEVVEEVVEVAKEEFAEQAPTEATTETTEEAPKYVTMDEVKSLLDEFKSEIMESISGVKTQVEEFGKQPISKPVTEQIVTPSNSKYSDFAGI